MEEAIFEQEINNFEKKTKDYSSWEEDKIKAISVALATEEDILSWSHGEVKRADTINYKTFKPERHGLFDEVIFGPTVDFRCAICGRRYNAVNSGEFCSNTIKCKEAKSEILPKSSRRRRMGHIKLYSPVVHFWYFKIDNSILAKLLGLKVENTERLVTKNMIESVIYYKSHIVVESAGIKSLPKNLVINISDAASIYHEALHEILQNQEDEEIKATLKETIRELEESAVSKSGRSYGIDFYELNEIIHNFSDAKIMTGAAAIEYLLENVDLEKEKEKVEQEIARINNQEFSKSKISILKSASREKLYKRLRVINSFINSGQHPRSLMIRALPVIPVDLRPMIQLEGGRHSTSDVNELYRRVIIRNNRLKKWIETEAPNLILQNELRMLQEAVDALIDNQRKHTNSAVVTTKDGRAFKSISDALVGKKGRFRQNLLGKRVDYSGRSVIVVGPELKMHQCGLPREMAAKLFEPWIIRGLINSGASTTIKTAKKLIDDFHPVIWPIVEEVIKGKVVLLNRAPSLHRLSIQAFEPKLVRGRAIHLHPLVTTAFNADFDGDQMAVHVPLSDEAILEAKELMLANKNILGPKDGEPIINPSQDMILGIYWLTQEIPGAKGEGKIFQSLEHMHRALENNSLSIHARVALPLKAMKKEGRGYICSSVGKFIFNSVLPHSFPFIYDSNLEISIGEYIEYSQQKLLAKTAEEIPKCIKNNVTDAFNKNAVARIIRHVFNEYNFEVPKEVIASVIIRLDFETSQNCFEEFENLKNPKDLFGQKIKKTHALILSEATAAAFNKLKRLRPFDQKNDYITSKEKVKILDEVWFDYTNYIAQILDQIKELGFKYSTASGISIAMSDVMQIKEKEDMVKEADEYIKVLRVKFEEGEITDDERYLLTIKKWTEVKDETQKLVSDFVRDNPSNPIVSMIRSGARGNISHFVQLSGIRGLMANNVQTQKADAVNERVVRSIVEVPIKSSFIQGLTAYEFFSSTHGARKGLTDVALNTAKSGYLTRRLIDVAQSIIVKEEDCDSDYGFWVKDIIDNKTGQVIIPLSERIEGRYSNQPIFHKDKMIVDRNQLIDYEVVQKILKAGIKVVQIRSVLSCHTRNSVCRMCYGKDLATNKLVEIGEAVGITAAQSIGEPGTQLTMRTFHTGGVAGVSDITGGFTRLIELIDAYEKPWGTPAEISPVNGRVIDIVTKKNDNKAMFLEEHIITLLDEDKQEHLKISTQNARKPRVKIGEVVKVGQKLTEGPINLQQLLRLTDTRNLQNYMLKEIQRLYRMQGISISDKYIEIIVRQLLSKLVISSPGDSKFHAGAIVDAYDYQEENARLMLEDKHLAYGKVVINGAKHVPLLSSSFLAAASYQETAKILVYASISNQIDNLEGLKENIIIGHKIPAGTSLQYHADAYSKFDIKTSDVFFDSFKNQLETTNFDYFLMQDFWAKEVKTDFEEVGE